MSLNNRWGQDGGRGKNSGCGHDSGRGHNGHRVQFCEFLGLHGTVLLDGRRGDLAEVVAQVIGHVDAVGGGLGHGRGGVAVAGGGSAGPELPAVHGDSLEVPLRRGGVVELVETKALVASWGRK